MKRSSSSVYALPLLAPYWRHAEQVSSRSPISRSQMANVALYYLMNILLLVSILLTTITPEESFGVGLACYEAMVS
eukprot:scaffold288499_cov19-Prasinocladus_malaysianus.AAC.1